MVHLLPLPGSPGFAGSMMDVIEQAQTDAETLIEAGFDGILFENYGDLPFYPNKVPVETIACMSSAIAQAIGFVKIPFGINVLRNDAQAAIAIATATGASFVRVNVHVNFAISEQGLLTEAGGQMYRDLLLPQRTP